MNFTRRGILTALGIGTIAGPVAAPAFGKALVHGQISSAKFSGLGLQYGGEAEATTTSIADIIHDRNLARDVFDVIGHEWKEKQKEAQERLNTFEQQSEYICNLLSWSPWFRATVKRQEYERRRADARSIRDKVSEMVKAWWKQNGDKDTTETVYGSRDYGQPENVGSDAPSRY